MVERLDILNSNFYISNGILSVFDYSSLTINEAVIDTNELNGHDSVYAKIFYSFEGFVTLNSLKVTDNNFNYPSKVFEGITSTIEISDYTLSGNLFKDFTTVF